jgi:sugar-specific transcriptional regulator TrmB
MEKILQKLGWSQKEIRCYLALLEYGQQPASVLAKKLDIPKATVLFTLNGLVDKGYIQLSKRGKTQYYFANPDVLDITKKNQIQEEQKALEQLIPLLKEYKNPLTSPPKVTFFEGVSACKKAYSDLLNSKTDILEFATHDDLIDKFGDKWMNEFVTERAKKKIKLHAICNNTKLNQKMNAMNKEQQRYISFIPDKKGKMYSCIVLYNDKLLMLNLSSDPFGILIKNAAIVETMKTIHGLAWK